MISRLHVKPPFISPSSNHRELKNESDVEQKYIYPFLTSSMYLNIPNSWIRTKEYMTPTEIDKAAGKRHGYFPDYSIWIAGLPLVIIEAKDPNIAVEVGLREARLYANEINKRYPPDVNPIGYIVSCNGEQISLSEWDSEVGVLTTKTTDARPGTSVLSAFVSVIGREALEARAQQLSRHFSRRHFFPVSAAIGGQSKLTRQLGFNEFAQPLFPILTKYFDNAVDIPDEIIDRAYVNSDEITTYGSVLETYLKDRTHRVAGQIVTPIETTKNNANSLNLELKSFANRTYEYSRVQIVVGSVGAGKSTFIRRYHRHLMSADVRARTCWAFIDFNDSGPNIQDIDQFVEQSFLQSFEKENEIDYFDEDNLHKIFAVDIGKFERGNKSLRDVNPAEFVARRASKISTLISDTKVFAESVARHFCGERSKGLVVVFDNVDKRTRDQQLQIFESAQRFKTLTKGLIIINLRDSTFEAYKDEPPLNAFSNAINFYIKAPRFAQVIRKRLELVMETLLQDIESRQEYTLPSGYRISYPSSRLGDHLLSIYLSLFNNNDSQIASTLEALVGKDVRRALSMFSEIIVSPHIPTNQITGAAMAGASFRIPERHIIGSLMKGRYRLFNGKSAYIQDIISADTDHHRPSNFIFCDVLEYLIRNRKAKIDFQQEGYATIDTVVKQMGRLGYDEQDAFSAIKRLAGQNLIEPEALINVNLKDEDAVRVHAAGFVHSHILLNKEEYLIGVTTVINMASKQFSDEIGQIWAASDERIELGISAKIRILTALKTYFDIEYTRRCRRHAFYEDLGLGGKRLVSCTARVLERLEAARELRRR